MIVAGEASGDKHAAKLVSALREIAPETAFFGATGPALRALDVETTVNSDELSIVGLPEIAAALPMFIRTFRKLLRSADERKPDAVVLVDFPDFNLKLAKSLKKRGFRVVYYISPQLWAWRSYRSKTIRKYVDLLISILPFEKEWYAKRGIHHVEYVGNPLAREVHPETSREEFRAKHSIDLDHPFIALLPGSRSKEVRKILPLMMETAAEMLIKNRELQFGIALASERFRDEVESAIKENKAVPAGSLPSFSIISGETYDLLNAADAAAVTSGTATLETGIIGTPMAIVYKTSALNYKLLRPLIDVEHFGLINLIAEERVAKELIQDEFTPKLLAEELFHLLDAETNKKIREDLRAATDKLGHGGASKRAAEAIIRLLES